MGNLDYKQFSRRRRPHIHAPGANLFLTYRLAGSIPKATVREYKARKEWLENEARRAARIAQEGSTDDMSGDKPKIAGEWLERIEKFKLEWFIKYEDVLHKAETGPVWMKNESAAETIEDGLHRLDGEVYQLDAYCVMSNHVHVLFKPYLSEAELRETRDAAGRLSFAGEYPGLSRIMHALKGRSARECNLALSRTGDFWEHESFDHVVRAGRLARTVRYILNNPVKAGLVKDWREWRSNYCRPGLDEEIFGQTSDKP